jgi:PAS domain S-box-containing protein
MTTETRPLDESAGDIRVLHVDDDPEFADLTATLLEREDGRFSVGTAVGASEGLDCLDGDVDCVVSDYDMPGTDGVEFLRTVREDHPEVPFILFTGKGSEEIASEAISAGVTDYLQKGTSTEQYALLANRIANAVEQARANRRATEHRRVSTVVREIDQALVRATGVEEVNGRVCEILVDADPYVFAWIGTVDGATDRIEPQASAGRGDGYLEEITVTADDNPTGKGPGGTAVREGRVAVSGDIRNDDSFVPWREEALERGFRAAAAIPLVYDDTRYGLLSVYADTAGVFDASERSLLSELGDTIAHTYHRLDVQREYQNQYRELFEEAPVMFAITREVDGEPVVEDCNRLFADTLGYTCEELRGSRLAGVYDTESARRLLDSGGYERALAGEFIRERRTLTTREGETVEALLRATPRRDTGGEIVGTHALYVDITGQTRLQSLEALRERLQFALDATDSILFEADLESGQETRHGPFSRLFGINSDRVASSSEFYERCVHPADTDEVHRLQRPEALADVSGTLEYDFRTHPDAGEVRWIHSEAYVSIDADGKPQRLIGLDTDIKEHKNRERDLERYETIVKALGDPVYALDADGHYTFVNDALVEETGYGRDELLGEYATKLLSEEDVATGERLIADLLNSADRRTATFEMGLGTAGGEAIPAENTLALLPPGEDGEFRGTAGIVREVTDRKKRERRLKSLNQTAQRLIAAETREEVAEVGVDAAREVLALEASAIHVVDEESALVPVAVSGAAGDLVDEPPALGNRDSIVWRVYEEGEALVVGDGCVDPDVHNPDTPAESALYLPMGDEGVLIAASSSPEAFDRGDVVLGEVLASTLVTALEQVEQTERLRTRERELTRQNDRLEEFARFVSHDLRNPMSVAEGRLELARGECDSEHLDGAAAALDRMETLIENLLTLAREGEVGELETVDLASLVGDSWQNVETPGGRIEVACDGQVRADRSRLQQLLENLVRNAVEHGSTSTPPDARGDAVEHGNGDRDVAITVGRLEDGFYVEDDGPGIPADERESVFEAGYSTAEDGTGVGLSIVEQVARAHGWTVRAAGSPAGGARFEITGVEFVDG